MTKKWLMPTLMVGLMCLPIMAENKALDWPALTTENKPGTRWWWLGSSVDEANITWNMESLQQAGIATVEITPIYGVKGKESMEIPYLSEKWMSMLGHVHKEAQRLGMQVDMNGGTGWPFGGPNISPEYAATKQFVQTYDLNASVTDIDLQIKDAKQKDLAYLEALVFVSEDGKREQWSTAQVQDARLTLTEPKQGTLYALYVGKTRQKVKRSAPGGEGYVMNHLSKDALMHYLKRFDEAFANHKVAWPTTFFNDSYEVYGADWSPQFLEEFKNRRGYDFLDYLPEWAGQGDPTTIAKLVCDYRQTIADMLLDNFTIPWTEWAHSHGAKTRNQAHGSPGNLLDLYAAMDIPECESFGCTQFDIPRLRVDENMRRNDAVSATLRYASSAAHVAGKPFTSSESMTWLTEHFRTSLALIKPEMDLLFVNGVNRVFYHGTPYTPKDAPWPGWLFYASIQINPNNTIFRDLDALNTYIARVQSFMQAGRPDNEMLLYFPIYDIWEKYNKKKYMTFEIHKLDDKLPHFEHIVDSIISLGYELDYVSDDQLQHTQWDGTRLQTQGNEYKSILVPRCEVMPVETLEKLLSLAEQGARLMFLGNLPSQVPGLFQADERLASLQQLLSKTKVSMSSQAKEYRYGKGSIVTAPDLSSLLSYSNTTREELSAVFGAKFARRQYEDGKAYFVSMLQNRQIDGWVTLGTDAKAVMLFDPMTGEKTRAHMRHHQGKTQIYLQLQAGESMIIRTWDEQPSEYHQVAMQALYQKDEQAAVPLKGKWTFSFAEGWPETISKEEFSMMPEPTCWTDLQVDQAKNFAGSGVYRLRFKMPKVKADDWCLDFGNDLFESAVVRLNGEDLGKVWAVPYQMNVGKYLKPGKYNEIEIKVTNLPANLIADYDRRGVDWRIFKDINIVSVFYKPITFDVWETKESGLTASPVLIPLKQIQP